jgi:hypothetical protein
MVQRVTADDWREVQQRRFPQLPFDCGKRANPGVRYHEDLRDWSDKATTPDQRRMEHYIDRYDLSTKRVLHIGIGNSGLARRFQGRAKEIVGTTIDEPEIAVAQSLGLPNYRYLIHNKYSGQHEAVEGRFDFILDNNPTSPCCCVRHLGELFAFYAAKLAPGGQMVTDRIGLRWVPDDANRRWSFDFDDFAAAGAIVGFTATPANKNIFVLSRGDPRTPGISSRLRYWGRRAVLLPGQMARNGPRLLKRAIWRATKR